MKRKPKLTRREKKALRPPVRVEECYLGENPKVPLEAMDPGKQAVMMLLAASPGIERRELEDAGAVVVFFSKEVQEDPRYFAAHLLSLRGQPPEEIARTVPDALRFKLRGILECKGPTLEDIQDVFPEEGGDDGLPAQRLAELVIAGAKILAERRAPA